MQTVIPFDFATVVCDGCARRLDSHYDGERLYDYAELIEEKLEDLDWQKVDEKDDDKWLCPECIKDHAHRKHPGEGRIIVEKMPLFGMKCDLCGAELVDIDEYSWWELESVAEERTRDSDWQEIGGKWYCPDCYQTCKAMVDENDGVENWEEVYCSKCKYKDDCNEVEPRTIPYPNRHECDKNCPYRKGSTAIFRCEAPADAKCPRVEEWKNEGIAKQESANAKALEACGKKCQ